ncbi:MAG: molybdenum cofactor guanylyltransferase MobA [Allorhizobium sp.]
MTAQRPPGIILAGGRSSRMGSDKRLALLGKTPMIAAIIERLRPQVSCLAINAPTDAALNFGLPLVPDTIGGHAGPLAGVAAALRCAARRHPQATHLLSVPADSPFFPRDLGSRLSAAIDRPEAIAVAGSCGHMHPVFALWPLSLADDLEGWLEDPKNRKLTFFIARHPNHLVDFPTIDTAAGPLDPFFNINTPDDLSRAHAFLEGMSP